MNPQFIWPLGHFHVGQFMIIHDDSQNEILAAKKKTLTWDPLEDLELVIKMG